MRLSVLPAIVLLSLALVIGGVQPPAPSSTFRRISCPTAPSLRRSSIPTWSTPGAWSRVP
jgi:hypothetical protein